MTLEDLEVIRYDAYRVEYDKCPDIDPPEKHIRANRAALRAVVEALRDEMTARWEFPRNLWIRDFVTNDFNEILASDGGVKAAGSSTSNDERGLHALDTRPAADPAGEWGSRLNEPNAVAPLLPEAPLAPEADVCVWRLVRSDDMWVRHTIECSSSEDMLTAVGQVRDTCPSCGKPIKFMESKNG